MKRNLSDLPPEFIVDESLVGERLDKALSKLIGSDGISRNLIARAIREGRVRVNTLIRKPSYKLKLGDRITVDLAWLKERVDGSSEVEPRDIDIEVLYEDEWLLVVNKPSGLISHPASPADTRDTVLHAVTHHMLLRGDRRRPLLVHRLDKDTTGCLMIAKDLRVHNMLKSEFKMYKRLYLALAEGEIKPQRLTIEAPLWHSREDRLLREVVPGGKMAITHLYKLRYLRGDELRVEVSRGVTALLARLETGRTHQIRAHLKATGHPILGDRQYGSQLSLSDGYALHAWKLVFRHPMSGELVEVTAPLRRCFSEALPEEVLGEVLRDAAELAEKLHYEYFTDHSRKPHL